uniref:Uncharacterized protein n=1 Tax=Arundo donax TaxID=35708 RepID=A0A0A9DGD4_ARUDO
MILLVDSHFSVDLCKLISEKKYIMHKFAVCKFFDNINCKCLCTG